MPMQLEGACFCGAIQWQAAVDENFIGICHCRDCQILGGGAFRTVGVAHPQEFRFTSGSPRRFAKTGDSGNTRDLVFCADCGTHLCSLPQAGAEAGFVSIRLATSRQFDSLQPVMELFCDSRVAWLNPVDEARQYPRMPGSTW